MSSAEYWAAELEQHPIAVGRAPVPVARIWCAGARYGSAHSTDAVALRARLEAAEAEADRLYLLAATADPATSQRIGQAIVDGLARTPERYYEAENAIVALGNEERRAA